MAAISFVVVCKELKVVQIAQINQLFQPFNLICAYSKAVYGLTRMIVSKNVNNDVRKDLPIKWVLKHYFR